MKNPTILGLLLLSFTLANCDDDEPIPAAAEIDLAAQSIEFTIDKTSDFAGTATIRGVVENIADDYVSDPGQQSVYLYEQHPGGDPTLVAQKDFSNLSAGGKIEVKYSRQWSSSAEFPPKYILSIGYGPDIYIDGNELNDDGNNDNNRMEREGSEINDLF